MRLKKRGLELQKSSMKRTASAHDFMNRSEFSCNTTKAASFKGGEDDSMYIRNKLMDKSLLTTTTTTTTTTESSKLLLHKSQNSSSINGFEPKSYENDNSDTILTHTSVTTHNITVNSSSYNDTNSFQPVYPLNLPQQSSNDFITYTKQDECVNQNLPSPTYLNCTNQDLYENIDFHPENINFSDMQVLWEVKEPLNILLRVSLVAPIVLLGILGNLTIIYSMYKFKPFRSKPTNIFILNMAVADFLTTLVCPNAALFTYIYQFYVLGPFICRIEGFVKITCFLVSSYSLIVLSSDWLLCVVQPCRNRITIKQSWFTLIIIWIISVIMASPLLVLRKLRHRQWKDLVEVWCCELIQYSKYYWVVINFFLIYLPTFFMTIVLVIILAQMDKFEAKLRRSRTTQNNVSLTINMKYRRRIVKILFTYLLISIICWTPLQVFIIYRHFRTESIAAPWFFELNFFTSLSASLTAATNPIIFGFLSQPFRKLVTKSLMFKFLDKLMTTNNNSENRQQEIHAMNNHHHHRHHHQLQQQQQQQQHHKHNHHHHQHNHQHNNNVNKPHNSPSNYNYNNNSCQTSQKNTHLSRSPQNNKLDPHDKNDLKTRPNQLTTTWHKRPINQHNNGDNTQKRIDYLDEINSKELKVIDKNNMKSNQQHEQTLTDNTTNNSFRHNQTTTDNNITGSNNKKVSFNTITQHHNPIINYIPGYGRDNCAYDSQEYSNLNTKVNSVLGSRNKTKHQFDHIDTTQPLSTLALNDHKPMTSVNTTSFIQRISVDDLHNRPMSVVSMDSINIEENINSTGLALNQINDDEEDDIGEDVIGENREENKFTMYAKE